MKAELPAVGEAGRVEVGWAAEATAVAEAEATAVEAGEAATEVQATDRCFGSEQGLGVQYCPS